MDVFFGGPVAGELEEVFDQVASASAVDSEGNIVERYQKSTLKHLAWHIENRAYGPDALRLCHLLRVAAACGNRGGYKEILWPVQPIRAGVLRQLIPQSPTQFEDMGIEQNNDSLLIRYSDGTFSLSHAAVAELFGLFEFSATVLGLAFFDELVETLAAPRTTKARVSKLSNHLQSALYTWLAPHVQAIHDQRNGRRITRFLKARNDEDFDAESANDDAILEFWLSSSSDPNLSFRLYQTVYAAFRQIARDLKEDSDFHGIRRAVSTHRAEDEETDLLKHLYASPSGNSHADDDYSTNNPFEVQSDPIVEEEKLHDPVKRLESADLSKVRFLNKKDLELIRYLVEDPNAIDEVLRSTLRTGTLGQGQHKLGKHKSGKPAVLRSAIEEATERSFNDLRTDFRDVSDRLDMAIEASLYVLNRYGADAKNEGEPVIEMDFQQMARARQAFENINRAGFRQQDMHDAEVIAAHRLASREVTRLKELLERIQLAWTRLLEPEGNEQHGTAMFREDRELFAAQFVKLYGVEK